MRLRSWRKLHYSLLSCNNECSVSTIPFNRKPIASLENLRKKFRKIELDPLLNGFCLFLSRNIDEIDEIQWRWNYVNVKWDSHSSTSAQPLNWSNKAQLNVEYLRPKWPLGEPYTVVTTTLPQGVGKAQTRK